MRITAAFPFAICPSTFLPTYIDTSRGTHAHVALYRRCDYRIKYRRVVTFD